MGESGRVTDTGGQGFHMIALVEYPSRHAFLAIATHPHVQEIGVHHVAGLESQWTVRLLSVNSHHSADSSPRAHRQAA